VTLTGYSSLYNFATGVHSSADEQIGFFNKRNTYNINHLREKSICSSDEQMGIQLSKWVSDEQMGITNERRRIWHVQCTNLFRVHMTGKRSV
jgi:hypothetical protein